MSGERRLAELGLELPPAPRPLGVYAAAVESRGLLFLSGMLPGPGATGQDAARRAALNALAVARDTLGSLDRVARVVRTTIYVASPADFDDLPAVADGASELFRDVFGGDRLAARSVLGVAALPRGVPVLLEVVFELN